MSTKRHRRALSTTAAAFAVVGAIGLGFPGTAQAHTTLVSSTPEDGATIESLPTTVSFTFDENVATPAFVAVTAPDGKSIIDGSPNVLDATVTQEIKPVGEKGTYSMSYRVISSDGHPVTGTLRFTVSTGTDTAQVAPTVGTGGDDDHSEHSASSGSLFQRHSLEAVIAVVVVVLGAVLLIGSRTAARRRDDPT
jgi:methionine-rich copper-binding protein CopC